MKTNNLSITEWLSYHLFTKPKRHFAHKLYNQRMNDLNNLIRVVISFDETTSQPVASIRYRDFIITTLDELDSATDLLHTLRKLNRHTIL